MSGIAPDIARGLIMVDTHDGGETEAAELLQETFANGDISATIVESEPDRGNVVAVLPGGPEAGLLLHSHLDTAGFGNIEQWKHSPLSGQMDNGKLYGRGALDCKGLAAVHTEVMVRVHALNLPLRRPLVLLASAGEETGGMLGSQYLLANNDDVARCGHVLGEGGGYSLTNRSPFRYTVQTGEFGRFEFPTGDDGASFWKGLIRSPIAGLFQALREGTYSPELYRHLLGQAFGRFPTRLDGKEMFTTRCQWQEGVMMVDTPFSKRHWLRQCFGPDTNAGRWTVLPSKRSSQNKLMDVLRDTLAEHGNSLVRYVSPGHSDNRYFRAAGMETLGFFPLTYGERLSGIHGYEESISLASLRLAADLLFEIVCNFILEKKC